MIWGLKESGKAARTWGKGRKDSCLESRNRRRDSSWDPPMPDRDMNAGLPPGKRFGTSTNVRWKINEKAGDPQDRSSRGMGRPLDTSGLDSKSSTDTMAGSSKDDGASGTIVNIQPPRIHVSVSSSASHRDWNAVPT